MTPLSPTPLPPRTPIEQLKWAAFRIATAPPGECFMEADLDLTAAVASVERSLTERTDYALAADLKIAALEARVESAEAYCKLQMDIAEAQGFDLDDLRQRLAALSARNEALGRYAGHHDDCNAVRQGGELRSPPVPCSCGYSSLRGDNNDQSSARDKLSVIVIRALTKAQEELLIVETEIGVPSEALPLIRAALAAHTEQKEGQ